MIWGATAERRLKTRPITLDAGNADERRKQ